MEKGQWDFAKRGRREKESSIEAGRRFAIIKWLLIPVCLDIATHSGIPLLKSLHRSSDGIPRACFISWWILESVTTIPDAPEKITSCPAAVPRGSPAPFHQLQPLFTNEQIYRHCRLGHRPAEPVHHRMFQEGLKKRSQRRWLRQVYHGHGTQPCPDHGYAGWGRRRGS